MKIGRRRAQLLLLLVASIPTVDALGGDLSSSDLLGSGSLGGVVGAPGGGSASKAAPVGTKHAPVDGKDGMPHEGPFVETDAERTRKKQDSEATEDEITVKESYKDLSSKGDLPRTNDAVMDDRVNSKPVEGTRGTEGGISEKSKEYTVSEKRPEAPKDARPVPHSEQEKLKDADEVDVSASPDDEVKKFLAVRRPQPGRFGEKDQVITHVHRSRKTSPRSHTIFPILRTHPPRKMTYSLLRTQRHPRSHSSTNQRSFRPCTP